jgi:hypothetical protein
VFAAVALCTVAFWCTYSVRVLCCRSRFHNDHSNTVTVSGADPESEYDEERIEKHDNVTALRAMSTKLNVHSIEQVPLGHRIGPFLHVAFSAGDYLSDVLFFTLTDFHSEWLHFACFLCVTLPLVPAVLYWVNCFVRALVNPTTRLFKKHDSSDKAVLEFLFWIIRFFASFYLVVSAWICRAILWKPFLVTLQKVSGSQFQAFLPKKGATYNERRQWQQCGINMHLFRLLSTFELIFETLPMLFIQVYNQLLLEDVSNVFIASMAFTAYMCIRVAWNILYVAVCDAHSDESDVSNLNVSSSTHESIRMSEVDSTAAAAAVEISVNSTSSRNSQSAKDRSAEWSHTRARDGTVVFVHERTNGIHQSLPDGDQLLPGWSRVLKRSGSVIFVNADTSEVRYDVPLRETQ